MQNVSIDLRQESSRSNWLKSYSINQERKESIHNHLESYMTNEPYVYIRNQLHKPFYSIRNPTTWHRMSSQYISIMTIEENVICLKLNFRWNVNFEVLCSLRSRWIKDCFNNTTNPEYESNTLDSLYVQHFGTWYEWWWIIQTSLVLKL